MVYSTTVLLLVATWEEGGMSIALHFPCVINFILIPGVQRFIWLMQFPDYATDHGAREEPIAFVPKKRAGLGKMTEQRMSWRKGKMLTMPSKNLQEFLKK